VEDKNIWLLTFMLFCLTLTTRLIPLLIKPLLEKSYVLQKVGFVLPGAIMLLLFLNSLELAWIKSHYALPEIFALAISITLFFWRGSLPLALIVGSICYFFVTYFGMITTWLRGFILSA